MQDGGSPSFLRLLEGSLEMPNFCFHRALLGPTHKCAPSCHAGSTELEEMGLTRQDPLDCCGATDVPDACTDLKCFVLSSTPLRKVYSPHNLILDSDTDSGWSMCMATPTCLKRTPLAITSDDDSPTCTVLDSSIEGEGVGAGPSGNSEDRSRSGEKIHNAVFWKPKEKPVARALFSKPSPPSRANSDGSSHLPCTPTLPRHSITAAQRLQGRFEQCVFSPITPSPLVHQSCTPLVPANDSSLLCTSVVAETPPGKRQGCEGGQLGGGDKHEESAVSSSQELFASPETLGTTAAGPKPMPTSAQHQQLAECHTSGALEPLQDQPESVQLNPTTLAGVVEGTSLREPAGTADCSLHHNQSDVFDLLFMSGSQLESHFHPPDRHDQTPTGKCSDEKPTDSSPTVNTGGADRPLHPQNQNHFCNVSSQTATCKPPPTACVSPSPPAGSICNSVAKVTSQEQSYNSVPALVSASSQTAATSISLQEPQKLPDKSPALKRRKLTNKTFLYPGSKQLSRGRKRAVSVKTEQSGVEQRARHKTDSLSSNQAVDSSAVRSSLRHKKRKVMISDAPPVKKPCLETEGSGEDCEVGEGGRIAGIEPPLRPLDSMWPLDQNKPCTKLTLELAAKQQCMTTPPPAPPAGDVHLDKPSTVATDICNSQSTSDLDRHGSDGTTSYGMATGDQQNTPNHNPPAKSPTHNPTAELNSHNPPAEPPTHNPTADPPTHNPTADPPTHNPMAKPPTHNPTAEPPTRNPTAEPPTHNPPAELPTHPPAELPAHNSPAEPPTHNAPAESPTSGAVSQCQESMALRTGQRGKAKAPGLRRGDTRAWYQNGTGDDNSLSAAQPRVHCSTMSEIADSSKPPPSPAKLTPDPSPRPAQQAPDPKAQSQGNPETCGGDDCSPVVRGEPLSCTVTEAAVPFVGFQMASGKSVKISTHALKRARQLLEEAETSPHLEGHGAAAVSVPAMSSEGTISKTPSSRPTESQSHSRTLTSYSTQFKTPSIKTPSAVLADIPASAIKAVTPTPSTSTPHPLTVPRRTLSMKRRPAKPFKAPRPASGVSKTEEQHAIAKILGSFRSAGAMSDCQQVGSERRTIESGFSTAGGRKLTVSAQALNQAQLMIADDKENGIAGEMIPSTCGHYRPHPQLADHTHTPKPSGTGGLHCGKDLSISASALEQAQFFLPCVNVDTSPQVSKTPDTAIPSSLDGVCVGFQTASGKSLSVSSNSLARARSIIASVPVEDRECEPPSKPETADRALLTGFQTAGGKGISVSHGSLESAQRLVEGEMVLQLEVPEFHPELHPEKSMEGFQPQASVLTGFQTAGGRPLSVTARSLQSAKDLLWEKQDIQDGTTVEVPPTSMQIGSAETGTENRVLEGQNQASNTSENVNAQEGDVPAVNESQHPQEDVDFDDVDMDTVATFTQIDFCGRAQDRLLGNPQLTSSQASDLSSEQESEGFPPDEADAGCYFSTQVVRQLLEFSSGEESEEEGRSAVVPPEPQEASSCLDYCSNQNPKANSSSVEGSVSSTPLSNHPLSASVLQSQDIEWSSNGEAVEWHTSPFSTASPQGGCEPSKQQSSSNDLEVAQHLKTTLSPAIQEICSVACEHRAVQTHNDPSHIAPGRGSPTPLYQGLSRGPSASEDTETAVLSETAILGEVLGESELVALAAGEVQAKTTTNITATGDARRTAVTLSHMTTDTGHRMEADSSLKTGHLSQEQDPPPSTMTEEPSSDEMTPSICLSPDFESVAQAPSAPEDNMADKWRQDGVESGRGHFPGLQTASGKEVHISQLALAVVRQTQASQLASFPGLQTASGKEVHIPELALAAVRQSSVPDLQTASGKVVEISQASLDLVRRTSLDASDDGASRVQQQSKCGFLGLQTASGKSVAVTQKSLNLVRKTLDVRVGPEVAVSQQPKITFPGLQTASGRSVEVSETSLQAVRSLLQEGTDTARSGSGLPGLQTAGGRRVEVSETSLQAVGSLLQEGADTARNGSGLPGLQTAGGRRVEVSVSSLQAARRALHQEGVMHPRPGLPMESLLLGVSDGSCKVEKGSGASLLTAVIRSHDGSPESESLASRKSSNNNSGVGNTAPSTGSASQQVPTLSPATPTAAGNAATPQVGTVPPHYKPSFSATGSQPSTTSTSGRPSSDEGTVSLPTQRYKPIFKPGNTKGRGVATTPSLTSTPTPGIKQPTSVRGITTTPEGVMLDRAPPPRRRPLVPVQTFLDQDGAYLTATPTSRHSERTPFTTTQFSAPSSFQFNHNSASRPFHSVAIFGSHSTITPSATQSRPTEPTCRVTPTIHTGCTGQSGLSRSYATPRRRTRSKPGYAPVWKAAVDRRPQSQAVKEQQLLRETAVACTSSAASHKCTTISAPEEGTSLPVGGGCTSTQLQGSEAAESIPLSPINITLSQICALENSQAQQMELDQPSEFVTSTAEDSGYQSKNQTEVGASGSQGLVNTRACSAPEHALESGLASPSFSAFTETAKESLNDSLEERNCDPEEPDCDPRCETHENETDSASQIKVTSPPKPHDLRTSEHTLRTEASSRPEERSSHFSRTTEKRGPVRPQLGSLLATRLWCSSSQRTSLKEAVGGRVPGSYSQEELHSLGVHPSVVGVSIASAESFTFSGPHYFSPAVLQGASVCVGDGVMLQLREGCAGVLEFWQAFTASPGVEPRLISCEWFSNHWKWLVWKLAAMEVAYPREFAGRCLTPDWLALQLKSRYDREIDRAERPALRKICEHDDVPSRTMVLCVSHIHSDRLSTEDSIMDQSAATGGEGFNESRDVSDSRVVQSEGLPCVELTDGWYSLPAILDHPLRYMLKAGKITVGSKVITYGAELVGSTGPCHPLETPASLALRLSANSTRRARWFAPLGYQRLPHPFRLPLDSIFADGGLVGCVDVVVSRVYPLLFLEKAKEGRNVLRSARAEERVAKVHQTERQRKMEAICTRVEAEFQEEGDRQEHRKSTCRRSRRLNTLQIKQLQDGEEIHNALTAAPDPVAFQEVLSQTQQVLLESYRQSLRDQQQAQLQSRVRQAMEEAENSLPPPRNVVPLLRVRLVPVGAHPSSLDCQLSVWGCASEGVQELLHEGKPLRLFNVTASPNWKGLPGRQRLQLSATKATRYEPLSLPSWQLASYSPRQCVDIGDLPSVPPTHGEVDVVGVVISITSGNVPSGESAVRQLDTAYLASSTRHLLAVRVWNGFKAHALDDIITPGALLAVSNLSYRGHTHQLPMATATDSCSFSQNPKEAHLRQALCELRSHLPQCKGDFLRELEDVITSSYL